MKAVLIPLTLLAMQTLFMSHQKFIFPSEEGDKNTSENSGQFHLTAEKVGQSNVV